MVEIDITRLSSKGQIVIPVGLRKGFIEGEKLIIMRKDDEIILKKSADDLALLSEESFAKTWLNKKEDGAWKDL